MPKARMKLARLALRYLDGERHAAVADRCGFALAGDDRQPELARVDPRQGRDVVGHAALPEMGLDVFVNTRREFGQV